MRVYGYGEVAITTATVADLDTRWSSRVRATLVLATWADTFGGLPQVARVTEGGLHWHVPMSAGRAGTRAGFMWTLADHLSRNGGAVIPLELGRTLINERPPGPAYSQGLLPRPGLVSTVPVGLVPGVPLAAIAHRARQAAALIQPHPQALDVAAMQAVAVAVVARAAAPLSAEALVGQIATEVHTQDVRVALRRVPPLVRETSNPQRVAAQLRPYPGTASTVSVALIAFLLHPSDPLAAVRLAIGAGGTSAASAVLAGALCGAHQAEGALPAPLQIPQRLSRIANALAGLRAAA